MPEVNDFKVELVTIADRENLRLMIEVKRGLDGGGISGKVAEAVRQTFEVRPEVEVLPTGTLAREFESSVKAPRFVDKRH
jgi:phenylacetate-CoA ligase